MVSERCKRQPSRTFRAQQRGGVGMRGARPTAGSDAPSGTREEDYTHQQPSLTAQKLRRLELRAGARTLEGKPTGVWATRERMRQAEKQLAAQAEASYKRSVADCKAASPTKQKADASVTAGRASSRPSKGKVARQATLKPRTPAL